ncbi:hypothetical protein L1049_004066 [Liquidambar formosana]|uniref:Uncharacterized protein n=1 Tax=Liquidambar formosana TaxID=63359 RepID=A0AAP0WY19_LIQFO
MTDEEAMEGRGRRAVAATEGRRRGAAAAAATKGTRRGAAAAAAGEEATLMEGRGMRVWFEREADVTMIWGRVFSIYTLTDGTVLGVIEKPI